MNALSRYALLILLLLGAIVVVPNISWAQNAQTDAFFFKNAEKIGRLHERLAFRVQVCPVDNIGTKGAAAGYCKLWQVGGTAHLIDKRGYFLTSAHILPRSNKVKQLVNVDLDSWKRCPGIHADAVRRSTKAKMNNSQLFAGKIRLIGWDSERAQQIILPAKELAVLYDNEFGRFDISVLKINNIPDPEIPLPSEVTLTRVLQYADSAVINPRVPYSRDPNYAFSGFHSSRVLSPGRQRPRTLVVNPLRLDDPSLPDDVSSGARAGSQNVQQQLQNICQSAKADGAGLKVTEASQTNCGRGEITNGFSGSAFVRIPASTPLKQHIVGVVQGAKRVQGTNMHLACPNDGSNITCEELVIYTAFEDKPPIWPSILSIPPSEKVCEFISDFTHGEFKQIEDPENSWSEIDFLHLLNFILHEDSRDVAYTIFSDHIYFRPRGVDRSGRPLKRGTDFNVLKTLCNPHPSIGTGRLLEWLKPRIDPFFQRRFEAIPIEEACIKAGIEAKRNYARQSAREGELFLARSSQLSTAQSSLWSYALRRGQPLGDSYLSRSHLETALRSLDEINYNEDLGVLANESELEWQENLSNLFPVNNRVGISIRMERHWQTPEKFMSDVKASFALALVFNENEKNIHHRDEILSLIGDSLRLNPAHEIAISIAADMSAAEGDIGHAQDLKAYSFVLAKSTERAAQKVEDRRSELYARVIVGLIERSPLLINNDPEELAKSAARGKAWLPLSGFLNAKYLESDEK